MGSRSGARWGFYRVHVFSTFRGVSRKRAGAGKVLRGVQAHWGIENGRRDGMLKEDAGWVRKGSRLQVMAVLRKLTIDLCSFSGKTSLAMANRQRPVPTRAVGGTRV